MANALWRIEMLGGMKVQQSPRIITHFETHKTGALLACLALHLPRAYPRDVLAEQLWPDEEPEAIRSRLRQALSSLRRELEPTDAPVGSVLVADRTDVKLNPEVVTTDVAEFQAALRSAAAETGPCERAASLLHAVDLYRGELLPGFYEDWIITERERLAAEYCTALAGLASALATTGDLVGAIEYARRLVAADPLREDAICDLMRLYAAAGRFPDALRAYHELETTLREELAIRPSPTTQALLESLRSEVRDTHSSARPDPSEEGRPPLSFPPLEPDGGAVPLDSAFYVVRPTDVEFEEAIARRDSIVLVKGPRQTGKTSLLARGLQQARKSGARVVFTDLQKLTEAQTASADALFWTLAESLTDQLALDVSLEAVWMPGRGWNVNFERFIRREALGRVEGPIVWGLDEVDRLFRCPFHAEVFALFRSWHNERSLDPDGPWGQLTLAIAFATEVHLTITDINQSPFNVGTRLALEDFTRGEVAELNRRYGTLLRGDAEVACLYRLVGGHPYLVRRGLHALAHDGPDLAALEAHADREDGPFGDHLRRMWALLAQDAGLCEAVRAVLRGQPCPTLEGFYRLRSAGVLAGDSERDARPRCGLYRRFLEKRLS